LGLGQGKVTLEHPPLLSAHTGHNHDPAYSSTPRFNKQSSSSGTYEIDALIVMLDEGTTISYPNS
jgi:hypothetical protein